MRKVHIPCSLLEDAASQRAPSLVYFQIVLSDCSRIWATSSMKSGSSSPRQVSVTPSCGEKLFRFQRDGVTGAIDKLERIRWLHHRRQRRPREDVRGARRHQVLRAAQ